MNDHQAITQHPPFSVVVLPFSPSCALFCGLLARLRDRNVQQPMLLFFPPAVANIFSSFAARVQHFQIQTIVLSEWSVALSLVNALNQMLLGLEKRDCRRRYP